METTQEKIFVTAFLRGLILGQIIFEIFLLDLFLFPGMSPSSQSG